jgi:ribonucleoside-diphosphate reductase alpha chain
MSLQDARSPIRTSSPFVDAAAVEAWDAWFRWRDRDQLHDLSVDATIARVAHALAAAEPADAAAAFEKRLIDACGAWHLLLDERVLATAGTDRARWPGDQLVAVLNAALFVRCRFTGSARFDHVAFADMAALAVHALDNAMRLAPQRGDGDGAHLRIGVIGLADALAFLRLAYDSPSGRVEARSVARSLAEGCYRGTVRLACDCGAVRHALDDARLQPMLEATSLDLARDASRYGLRHQQLTAVTSQRRLALLANNVTDALDPLRGADHVLTIGEAETSRHVRSSGYAITIGRDLFATHAVPATAYETLARVPATAQIELRGAMQPWIDCPISYPIAVTQLPDLKQQKEHALLASAYRLGALSWNPLEEPRINGSGA